MAVPLKRHGTSRTALLARVAAQTSAPIGVARLRAFAARLLEVTGGRRGGRSGHAGPSALALVLRRTRIVVLRREGDRHWSVRASLRLAIDARAGRHAEGRRVATTLLERVVSRRETHVVHRSLHLRSIERLRPVAAAPAETIAAALRAAVRVDRRRLAAPQVAPIAMTVVRSPAAPARRSEAPPPADTGAAADGPPRSSTGSARRDAAAALTLAPPELSRVTEHVIRQLDRRIVSYQERTGQL
jgi:hypothetical protein